MENLIRDKAKNRIIGVFGAGNNSSQADSILQHLNIENYVYFDKYKEGEYKNGKVIYSPSKISKEYFVLVSSVYIIEISAFLEKIGMIHQEDWIYVLDRDYYEGIARNCEAPMISSLSMNDLIYIENGLKTIVKVEEINAYDDDKYLLFEKNLGLGQFYNKDFNKRYKRKILEYYYVDQLLGLTNKSKDYVYIDVGACGSPFVKRLREISDIKAYAVDLEKGSFNNLDYYMVQDAKKLDFADDSVDAITIQSAFEMFLNNDDKESIKEFSRVLKRGGKVLILPLYMHKEYLSAVSPNYYGTGKADVDALECIRTDCWSWIPSSRFYDTQALKERVIDTAEYHGLKTKIYSIPNENVEKDSFVYLKFILELTK